MNLPHTKAWWRSQAEHRFTLLRSAIAARNRYWRWLGNCWDESQRLKTRIAQLEVCIAEQERVLASSWEERRKAGAEEVRRLREDIEAKEHLLVEREARIAELEERLRMVAAVSEGITWGDEEP